MPTASMASRFARLALAGIGREFPHKPDHVWRSAADDGSPRTHHPAFFGCYDWHSAVHGHWLLVRVLRCFPSLPEAAAMRAALTGHLTADALRRECDYATQPGRASFERPYGWAWLFKLDAECLAWAEAGDADARRWHDNLMPLAALFRERLLDWLPRQRYPVRSGVHGNTAFMLAFAIDWADATGDEAAAALCRDAARRFYLGDIAAPAAWEPAGNDFLSPSLAEAAAMRRVLADADFADWLAAFLPGLTHGPLMRPVEVTDRADPQGCHLDGLNLSRAWHLRLLARGHPEAEALRAAAEAHLAAALPHVESGDFLGEHWLATFAALALDEFDG